MKLPRMAIRCSASIMQNVVSILLSRLNVSAQMAIKGLTLDRHIDLIKGILHDIVGVQLIHPSDHDIDIRLQGFGEEEELGPRQGLKALQSEALALEHFEARRGLPRSTRRVQAGRDGVYPCQA